ncbi:Eisosome component PIL1-domain-containing protein [Pilobolus umbonatus]|nr:Eisosome component PIL1-domain-containing protein [Pilobolus umbonatus]
MNFRDLQFNISKFKADVHSQIVKNNPMQKQDTKSLSLWIFQERNDLATLRSLAYHHSETNKALKQWIDDEVEEEKDENGRDLDDIVGDKLVKLLDKQVEVEEAYANKIQQYRHAIKAIREREEKLSDAREKKRSLQSRINNLSRSNSRSPKLMEFQRELRSLSSDTFESEMDLADFKRFALKEAFYLRFNAMSEYAEKTALIAGFGKYLTDLINIEPTPPNQTKRRPYDKGEEAAMILADATKAVDEWRPIAADERATLANSTDKEKEKSAATDEEKETSSETPPPPPLPSRPSVVETILPILNVPSGYTPTDESSSDQKTEAEPEVARHELFDTPPPAYAAPPIHPDSLSQTGSSQDSFLFNQSSFGSPYPSHATLAPTQYSPYPSHINLTDSPAPMHSQIDYSNQAHSGYPPHMNSSFYDPNTMMYSQVNYQQLYRHVSLRQQNQHYRPYSEFQQQFNHPQEQRMGMDAGGFRIPPAIVADEEKSRLEEHYRQIDSYYPHESFYNSEPYTKIEPDHGTPNVMKEEKTDEIDEMIQGITSSVNYYPPNEKDSEKYED